VTPALEREIDALYQLPLAQFTPARNELAARLKKAGDAEAAARVKDLDKPSVTAWAVNQLYWQERQTFEALTRAGGALRDAQRAVLTGQKGGLREAGDARDRAVAAAVERAAEFLARSDDARISPAHRARLSTTLETLAAYAGMPPGVAPGRLTGDVDPPGFAALAGLVPSGPEPRPHPGRKRTEPAPPPLRLVRGHRAGPSAAEGRDVETWRDAVAAAKQALAAARKEAANRHREASRANAAFKVEEGRAERARRAAEKAQAAWERARREAEEAERALQQARGRFEDALDARRNADRAVTEAEAALAELLP
jgi:hypothetical protein